MRPSTQEKAGILGHLSWLFAPVDIASLVYFRVAFGAIMLWETWRYYSYGWIGRYWIEPSFHFTYFGFDWVKPWPGNGMYLHFAILAILAVFIMLGVWYRLSATLFFLGFSYVFLLEQAQYLNHFYLICLISFLLIFLPLNRSLSFDAWLRPKLRASTAPAWSLWLLRFQIAVPYFFGGLAKLNGDWLQGEPMQDWLSSRTDFPLIGPYFTEEWMVYGFSYGGLLLDLLVVPFLLWRKTRPFAFATAVLFHLANARLFSIGIFPWFMIAATLLFFEPEWPRRLLRWLRLPVNTVKPEAKRSQLPRYASVIVALLGLYVALQVLLPLRHFVIPGNVSWTEEGHRFAWHMKLRGKDADVQFFVTNPATGTTWEIDPLVYLSERQRRKMSTRPYMILQFAHFLADELRAQGFAKIEVRARVMASLNGRPAQLLVDPDMNLAGQSRTPWPVTWILPLTEPLSLPATAD